MPMYDYEAFTSSGSTKKGLVESESAKAARAKLRKQGLMVTEIKERKGGVQKEGGNQKAQFSLSGLFTRVSVEDLALVTRQLASLVKANIPLLDALTALVDQIDNEKLKIAFAVIRQDVNEGSSFAKALKKHPKVFDNIFINMVEAGESSGTLGPVLIRLADLKEAQLRLKNKVQSAMMYPILMLVVTVGLVLFIFTFAVPQIVDLFGQSGKEIPTITKIMIAVSDSLINFWFIYLFATILAVWLFSSYIQTSDGRRRWDSFKLRSPIFGPLLRMIAVARFSNTMSTLLDSGVSIIASLTITKNLVSNVVIEKAIINARENVTEGQSIADPLKRSGEFPPMVIHMISIGEKTGELPKMLQNISNTYEEQVDAKIQGLTSLLEPLMIVVMGGVVGLLVLSIFMPLMEMNNIQ